MVKTSKTSPGGDLKLIAQSLKSLTEKQDLHFQVITSELSRIGDDVKDIRGTLSSMVRMALAVNLDIQCPSVNNLI